MPFGIEFNIGLGFFDRRQGEVRRRLLKLFRDTVDLFAQLLQAFSRFGADCSKTIVIDLSLIARCAAFSRSKLPRIPEKLLTGGAYLANCGLLTRCLPGLMIHLDPLAKPLVLLIDPVGLESSTDSL